jgi:hypothetical protein
MAILRPLLRLCALLWGVLGFGLVIAPGWVMGTILDQPVVDVAWFRLMGVMAIVLAMLMVLIVHRLDVVWWWSWAFAVLEVGVATVTVLHALFGLPPGVTSWPWWTIGAISTGLGAGLLFGIGETAREKPFV